MTSLSCPYVLYITSTQLHTHNISKAQDAGTRHLQLVQNNALGVRSTTKRLNLVLDTQGALLVRLVGPAVDAALGAQLARGVETSRLALAYSGLVSLFAVCGMVGKWGKRVDVGWMDGMDVDDIPIRNCLRPLLDPGPYNYMTLYMGVYYVTRRSVPCPRLQCKYRSPPL